MAPVSRESFIAGRDQRVAVGDDLHVVEVKAGDPWPPDAAGRVDVLIRTGHVIRFDESGVLDPRSLTAARRVGIGGPIDYPARSWAARARQLEQRVTIAGRRVRVFAGSADLAPETILVRDGRAFGLLRGAPDAAGGGEALEAVQGGGDPKPRRRSSAKRSGSGSKRRRRKPGK